MLAGSVDLGVIDGRDVVAVPGPSRLFVDELGEDANQ
jgi:hypothetical protein